MLTFRALNIAFVTVVQLFVCSSQNSVRDEKDENSHKENKGKKISHVCYTK